MRRITDLSMARRGLLALAAGLGWAVPGQTETYPSRPVRLIVPFTPGGGTDNLGRLVAHALTGRLGQTVVVENRGGAGGNIGQAVAATAPADGYTTLVTGNGIAISDLLFRNPGFDWKKDFVHIARFASTPMLLVVNNDVPVRSLTDFIAYARANRGKLNHGTPGAGTAQHLAAALFDDMAGTQIIHVPYRGTGPSVAGLLTGEVEVMFASVSAVETLIREGKVRALANTAATRARAWPELPTIGEALPGYAAELWYTFAAPAQTPAPSVATLEAASRDIMADAAFRDLLMERGFDPAYLGRVELNAALEAERKRWEPVLQRTGITPE